MNDLDWIILRALPEPIIFVDTEHIIQFMNPEAAELFEVSDVDDVIGTAFKLLSGGNGLMTREERIESIERTNPVPSPKPDDEQIWSGIYGNKHFRFNAIPVCGSNNKNIGFVIRVDEITKERLASEFLACLSSDMAMPITSIKGYAELLSTKELSPRLTEEQRKRFAEIIKRNALILVQLRDSIGEFFIHFR